MSIGGGRLFRGRLKLVKSTFRNYKAHSHKQSAFLPAVLAFALLTASCGGDLAVRASRAVGAIPSVVRILFPNASPSVFSALEATNAAFQIFVKDKTSSNWDKASAAWKVAEVELRRFGNTRLNQIADVVNLLLSQVIVPTGTLESVDEPIVVKFSEAKVKELEALVKQ